MTSPDAPEVHCPRTINDGQDACPWRGPLELFDEHTEDTGHEACIVCHLPLRDHEEQTCMRCIQRVAANLAEIENAYATLPTIVEKSGYHQAPLPGGNALVMLVDGALEGGGPDDHIRFHDPLPVLEVLHRYEREWRLRFNHSHFPRWQATVVTTIGYLRAHLARAARTLDDFGDFADEVRDLRSQLTHVAGLADDPEDAPANCFECGGELQRGYRPLRTSLEQRMHLAQAGSRRGRAAHPQAHRQGNEEAPGHPDARKRIRIPARTTRVRHAVAGDDREGLAPTWRCSRCRRSYTQEQYGLALQMRANSITGWVTVRTAAETLRRPPRTIWRWVEDLEVPSACSVKTRRVLVEWEQTKELSDLAGRRNRAPQEEAS
jgi:hypothetical protein